MSDDTKNHAVTCLYDYRGNFHCSRPNFSGGAKKGRPWYSVVDQRWFEPVWQITSRLYHFQALTFSWVALVGFFSQQLIDEHQSCLLGHPSYSMHFVVRRFSRHQPPLVKGFFLVKNSGIRGFRLRSRLFLWKFAFFVVSVAERWCLLRLRPYSVSTTEIFELSPRTQPFSCQ